MTTATATTMATAANRKLAEQQQSSKATPHMIAEWLDIGSVDQLPALGARTLPVRGGKEIAIFRTANGAVHALLNQCPHKQGPLSEGIVHDSSVTCPLHNWRISLLTGEALGEDKGCVPVIPVKIDGGRILIGRREALQGMA